MNIINRIKECFENGEDFQFQQWDIDELEKLQWALKWYADEENYENYEVGNIGTSECVNPIELDFGYLARKTLGIEE